jgi:hypothetical protein
MFTMAWRIRASAALACLYALALAVAGCAGVRGGQAERGPGYNWYKDWTPVGTPTRLDEVFSSVPLDEAVRQRAGAGARKCSGPAIVWNATLACVLQAREEHAAAFVSYGNFGIDSLLGWGVASLATGELDLFRYDSSPCGGGSCTYALRTTACRQVASVLPQGDQPAHICLDPEF